MNKHEHPCNTQYLANDVLKFVKHHNLMSDVALKNGYDFLKKKFNYENFNKFMRERFSPREQFVFDRVFGLDGNPLERPTVIASYLGINSIYHIKDSAYQKLYHVWKYIFSDASFHGYQDSSSIHELPLKYSTRMSLDNCHVKTIGDFKSLTMESLLPPNTRLFIHSTVKISEIKRVREQLGVPLE